MSISSFQPIMLSQQEKQEIMSNAMQRQNNLEGSRRVDVLILEGQAISGIGQMYSGWASGTAGNWAIAVDVPLEFHHFRLRLDQEKTPVGIEFSKQRILPPTLTYQVKSIEPIGYTTLPNSAIDAIGEALALKCGDYRNIYRNYKAFTQVFMELVCNAECNISSSHFIRNLYPNQVWSFSWSRFNGTILFAKRKGAVAEAVRNTENTLSWQQVVDAEITTEIKNTGLEVIKMKQDCSIL